MISLLLAQEVTAEQTFQQGVSALSRSDYPAAETAFQSVLKSQPSNLSALSNLGVVYSRTNRPAQAIRIYRQALQLAPQQPSLLLNLGLAYFKQQEYGQAFVQFQKVENVAPSNLQAQELAATCQVLSGNETEAIPKLEHLRQANSNQAGILYILGVAYTRAHRQGEAKAIFAQLLSGANSEQAGLLLGRAYYDSGDFTQAEYSYITALRAQPDNREAAIGLARTLISERKNTEAVAQLRAILEKNSADPDAHYYLGALLLQTGALADARLHLEIAAKAFPNSASVSFYLGRLAFEEHRYKDAVISLRRATDLDEGNDSAFYALAQALRTTGDTAGAKTALERVRNAKASALKRERDAIAVP